MPPRQVDVRKASEWYDPTMTREMLLFKTGLMTLPMLLMLKVKLISFSR